MEHETTLMLGVWYMRAIIINILPFLALYWFTRYLFK